MKTRSATKSDTEAMVALSCLKRKACEKAQAKFWAHADGAEKVQSDWFEELLARNVHTLLVEEEESMVGFLTGRILPAPEVHDPGGLTLMVDDFCANDNAWQNVGSVLLNQIKELGKEKGVSQVLVVSGAHNKEEQTRQQQ